MLLKLLQQFKFKLPLFRLVYEAPSTLLSHFHNFVYLQFT